MNVPAIRRNLFSVGQASDHGYNIQHQPNSLIVTNNDGNIKMTGRNFDNKLYCINAKILPPFNHINITVTGKESFNLWHYRFGHVGTSILKHMMKKQLLIGLPAEYPEEPDFCEPCMMGKMMRLPFTSSNYRATRPLEIIHTDVSGPMRTKSPGGSRYFVTFLDEYTNKSYIYFMKHKIICEEMEYNSVYQLHIHHNKMELQNVSTEHCRIMQEQCY